jgi:hypothetical protein
MIAARSIRTRTLSNSGNSRGAGKFFAGYPRTQLKRIALHGGLRMMDNKTSVSKPLSHWVVISIMFIAFVVVLMA